MDNREDENLGSFYMNKGRGSQPSKRQLPPGLLTGVAVLALTSIIWYAYPKGEEKYADIDIPVVRADTAPIKELPTDPGGMEVRHQDSTVFDPIEKKPGEVEKLRPTPEEPMDKREVIQSMETEKPDITARMEPKLDLELQTKDAAVGSEKVVPKQPVEPKPVVVTPTKEETVNEVVKEPVKAEPKLKGEEKPAPAASGGDRDLQLGSYRDISSVKTDWEKLKKKHPQYLGNLSVKAVRVDIPGKGIFYRMYAGKLTNERAKEICAALKTLNPGGCIVVKQ